MRPPLRQPAFFVALLVAAATLATGLTFATTAAGGADAHGYVSQADGWLKGELTVDQRWAADTPWAMARWTLTPLGYRPSSVEGRAWELVPSYAPGLPLLMAAAKALGGQELMFWVVPLSGAILVLATFGITRRLLTPAAGVMAAWLVATSPAILFMLMLPMSDVPAAAAWAVAFYGVLDGRIRWAAVAGAAVGIAITVRPNLAPAAAVLGAWAVARVWRAAGTSHRRAALTAALALVPGIVCGALVVAAVNQSQNGSPFVSGYGSIAGWFSTRFFWPNVGRYGTWLIETQTPLAILGAAALLLPTRHLWPTLTERSALVAAAAITALIWMSYLFYQPFDAWWYLRFVLPTWPLLAAGMAAVLHVVAARGPRARRVTGLAVLALGVWQVHIAVDRGVFRLWQDERRYVTVARQVRALTSPDSVVFSRQHSGSVRYYAGRVTVRFEEFEPGDVDRAVAWFADRGVRSYLLVDDGEIPLAREVMAGQEAAARLNNTPLLHYSGTSQVYLYELSHPRDRGVSTVTLRETWAGTRSVPPATLVIPDLSGGETPR